MHRFYVTYLKIRMTVSNLFLGCRALLFPFKYIPFDRQCIIV